MKTISISDPDFDELCRYLAQQTEALEHGHNWPANQLRRLCQAGVLGWVIPTRYGGSDLAGGELLRGYERLAASCLTTTFILTQRNGACQRIAQSEKEELRSELLPRLCSDALFATVGISHLTTSRQHLAQPAVRAEPRAGHWVFHGSVPWVTGARQAEYIVTGGTCDDGTQLLAAVPTAARGVIAHNLPRLLALNASQTGSVDLDHVEVPEKYVIAGPIAQVMKQGAGVTGSLTTSALALGAASGVLDKLRQESARRPDLTEIHDALATEKNEISTDMHRAAQISEDTSACATSDSNFGSETIRRRANSLVLRVAQAYLAASKGAGFVAGHPAERAVREAMFFLVWSCPAPVLAANLREFACVVDGF
jgi:alkylation response protein AidB-like acyl-CoA dehydrogenase